MLRTERHASTEPCPDVPGRFSEAEAERLAALLGGSTAEVVLRWAIEHFGPRLALVTSFQAEGMVLLDIACRIAPTPRAVTVDSGRLPGETYDLIDHVRERYRIPIEVYLPDPAELEPFVRAEGVNPFYRDVDLRLRCCEIRKVRPLARALRGFDAWVTGRRREQSSTRRDLPKVELDRQHGGLLKLNPLAGWSESQVWEYTRANDVPSNALYERGYTSIGCAPCTRATRPGEDPRAGRWWWERDVPKECGIHLDVSTAKSLWTTTPGTGQEGR